MRGLAMAVTCVLAGCGSGNPDGAEDASPEPDAPGPSVRVRTWSHESWRMPGVPQPDAHVWVNARDGTPAASGVTGADGEVVLPVAPGSTVSALFLTPGNRWRGLTTYVDVQPGDTLDAVVVGPLTFDVDAQFDVEVPARADATAYVTQTPYWTQAHFDTSLTVQHDSSRAPLSSIDELIIWARDANYDIVAAGLISPLDLQQTPVVLPAWTEAAEHVVMATGLPAGGEAAAAAWSVRGELTQEGSSVRPFDGVAQLRVSPFADRIGTQIAHEDAGLTRAVRVGSAPSASGVNVDFAALAVDPISFIDVDSMNRSVSWTRVGSRPYDVAELRLYSNDYFWHLYAPPEVDRVDLPQFPVELAGYEPRGYFVDLLLIDASGWSGYADVLATLPWEREDRVERGDEYLASSFISSVVH